METPIRLAHLSDLHASSLTFSLKHFFSKRWLGNANLLLSRKRLHSLSLLESLPALFQSLSIQYLLFTGDLSSTSLSQEWSKTLPWLHDLQEKGLQLLLLPGNHDAYTKESAQNKAFYHFYSSFFDRRPSPLSLQRDLVTIIPLSSEQDKRGWWYVGIDPTLNTPLLSSQGLFSTELEANLERALISLPSSSNILLGCHFPFSPEEPHRKRLLRGEFLQALLRKFSPRLRLYLHGHTHCASIQDLRTDSLPIVIDSGALTDKKKGSWNLIDLYSNKILCTPFRWTREKMWQPLSPSEFIW